jgi:hypothetical protein
MPTREGRGILIALLVPLILAALLYAVTPIRAAVVAKVVSKAEAVVLDTLSIGSFAATMAWLKFRKLVIDRLIPCSTRGSPVQHGGHRHHV